jgi:hypothetical protein
MNERIRELHSQCKVCDKDTVLYFDYEKFAELIIRQCAKVADGGWADPGHQIKQHFGVEL